MLVSSKTPFRAQTIEFIFIISLARRLTNARSGWPFYDNAEMSSHNGSNNQQLPEGEISRNGGMSHINPELQNNIHPSHLHAESIAQGHDHVLSQSVMNLQAHLTQPHYQQATAQLLDESNVGDSAKQRLKVSRACDECRRKKVC